MKGIAWQIFQTGPIMQAWQAAIQYFGMGAFQAIFIFDEQRLSLECLSFYSICVKIL